MAQTIPVHVLRHVFKHLDHASRLTATLVSKHYYKAAAPFAYSAVTLQGGRDMVDFTTLVESRADDSEYQPSDGLYQ